LSEVDPPNSEHTALLCGTDLAETPLALGPRRLSTIDYQRHQPEQTLLHEVIREHLEGFITGSRESAAPVARFVERELRGYLECGVLAHGFLRLHCDACGNDRLLAFSCKGRAVCPSCAGRRMADTAAHLVDRVIPEAPVRQWVLTLPYPLRYRCAWDARLTSEVLRAFCARSSWTSADVHEPTSVRGVDIAER